MTELAAPKRIRVLVTGATGLVGRRVCEALTIRKMDVHAASKTGLSVPGTVPHAADVTDDHARRELLQAVRPEIVVHAAWVTEHDAYWRSPLNLAWTSSTVSLAADALACGVRRLVGIGTCAEYEWGSDAPLSETASPLVPSTLYGACKDATRRVLEAYGRETGLSIAWARLGMLYGPGENPARFVASLASAFAAGLPARMSTGRVTRDYMHVRDVGAAVAALAASNVEGPVNIGAGRPTRLVEMGHLMARLSGRPDLLEVGALPDRQGEPRSIILDLTRLTNEVGFKPTVELEQGFQEMLLSFRTS